MGVYKYIHSRNVTRPQIRFKEKVDNSHNPFIPRIRDKPNAQVPLPEGNESGGGGGGLMGSILHKNVLTSC